ncbi:MAG TPA: 50S ribosomal protein L11 methyltransferase [Clostridiales bacterium]|nr:50S ribosomal protein L11 methyltransferase [Clostridiales bacterium]
MKWTKVTLDTTTEAVDLISDMLGDLGISGIEISDNVPLSEEDQKRMFIDILPELQEDDGTAKISFYVDEGREIDEVLHEVNAGLEELAGYVSIGSGNLMVTVTEDKDWINNWKEFFKPFRVDDTIVIKPTWEELEDYRPGDLVVEIDPGTSFGTGTHETTKLCIIGMKKYIHDNTVVLDAGSGSGILSIIAKKLGAKEVLGIDIDPNATNSAIENAEVNRLPVRTGSLMFMTGNIIEDDGIRTQIGKEKYDLVVANILADVIIPLSEVIPENLKPDGIFITSGIIDTKEEAVRGALEGNHFTILEVNRMGDWVSFVARRKGHL